jgi:hypothetical protein
LYRFACDVVIMGLMQHRGSFVRFAVFLASSPLLAGTQYFAPQHRLAGIGVDRAAITPEVLEARTAHMIQAQTFVILRHPEATAGAARITGPALQKIFNKAAKDSGLDASLIAAVAYLESWGDPNALSPTGPKGIMQFSEATARAAGLRVVRATQYRTVQERRRVRTGSGKTVYRTVRRKIPYKVVLRDDRLKPDKAVPAGARYLARLQDKFGGMDWAIFAYHCGEGCIADLYSMAQAATGRAKPTVAETFFAAHPGLHPALYEALQREMARDFSPTYYFRIQRAQQLLKLYQSDRAAFEELVAENSNPGNPRRRTESRLVVWSKASSADGPDRNAPAEPLSPTVRDPKFFGITPPFATDSPSAVGAMLYVAFETRRLFDELQPKGEQFVPLQIVKVGRAADDAVEFGAGTVFEIDRSNLGKGERLCLSFALDDLGWDGHLGLAQRDGEILRIGFAPSSRDFFAAVFKEAVDAKLEAGASELRQRAKAPESLQ